MEIESKKIICTIRKIFFPSNRRKFRSQKGKKINKKNKDEMVVLKLQNTFA